MSKAIEKLLNKNVEEVIVKKDLEKLLLSGKKLRIYIGVDPSSPVIHIGHAVGLRKLREFQDLGHKVIFLIGDFTGRIGDPSGKTNQRVPLTEEEVLENAKTYLDQASKIIDIKKAEIRYNAEWLDKLTFKDVVMLASNFTVQQMIERDMFKERLKTNKPIGLHEFLYPLMVGYDSVALDVDIEMGGTDQTFNMLAGRTLMKTMKGKEKHVLSVPLLLGTDGRKMSKSYGNVIGVDDPADDMFGKVMSIKDELIIQYFELCTDRDDEEIKEITKKLKGGENPRNLKFELAKDIVTTYHSSKAAETAGQEFEKIFKDKGKPTDMPKVSYSKGDKLVDVLVESKIVDSKSEVRRLIQQNGVKDNDETVTDIDYTLANGKHTVQVGKRRFVELSEK
ncbi:MAG: tyrosine--tRNA ligase [bacterium]|nr:tyrosine--tRNA ligase [bacterium]